MVTRHRLSDPLQLQVPAVQIDQLIPFLTTQFLATSLRNDLDIPPISCSMAARPSILCNLIGACGLDT
jgi:hypothetical protein